MTFTRAQRTRFTNFLVLFFQCIKIMDRQRNLRSFYSPQQSMEPCYCNCPIDKIQNLHLDTFYFYKKRFLNLSDKNHNHNPLQINFHSFFLKKRKWQFCSNTNNGRVWKAFMYLSVIIMSAKVTSARTIHQPPNDQLKRHQVQRSQMLPNKEIFFFANSQKDTGDTAIQ